MEEQLSAACSHARRHLTSCMLTSSGQPHHTSRTFYPSLDNLPSCGQPYHNTSNNLLPLPELAVALPAGHEHSDLLADMWTSSDQLLHKCRKLCPSLGNLPFCGLFFHSTSNCLPRPRDFARDDWEWQGLPAGMSTSSDQSLHKCCKICLSLGNLPSCGLSCHNTNIRLLRHHELVVLDLRLETAAHNEAPGLLGGM